MAVFAGRRDGSMRVKSPTSPRSTATTTFLADGYTEDGRLSPYDDMRRSSQFSIGSTINAARLSMASYNNLDETVVDEMLQRMGNQCDGVQIDGQNILREKPDDWFGKAKYYYDKYNLRHVAPFLLLFVYSLIGATLFYWVEYEHERELLRIEAIQLESLRNETFHMLKQVMVDKIRSDQTKLFNSRDVLVWYENQLSKLQIHDGLEWDMWGALFYVGTLFTTIGYGNIAPRTTLGQALSIVYALIGIPLVLAILSQFGRTLTKCVSSFWMKYRQFIKSLAKRKRIAAKTRAGRIWGERKRDRQGERELLDVEEGHCSLGVLPIHHSRNQNEDHLIDHDDRLESRTIPIWIALFICVGWICLCAGLFCLWETQWNYFTSLYFFFISLSTIGLGDIVPDHPRMLILMFWLVIIGLSIVSMLLGVIQIKMEEWLYNLMIKMQKEYQRALMTGDPIERQAIMNRLMKKEPWFMRNMAQHLISENQAAQLDHQAEAFEKSVRMVNNKNIQTEAPSRTEENETQVDPHEQNDVALDTPSLAVEDLLMAPNAEMATQWSRDNSSRLSSHLVPHKRQEKGTSISRAVIEEDVDSISDAPSLPIDNPTCALVDQSMQVSTVLCADRSQQVEPLQASGCGVQTDIAQFQVDEIMLKLHDLQAKSRIKPVLLDRSMETSMFEVEAKGDTSGEETDKYDQVSTSTQYDIYPNVVDISVTADLGIDVVEEGTETERNEYLLSRSMETDAWMAQLQMPECSRCSQTYFEDEVIIEEEELTPEPPIPTKEQEIAVGCEIEARSAQCETERADTCDTCVQTMLEMRDFDTDSPNAPRSSSLMSLHGSDDGTPRVEKQDLIIQTDDSYLKIARRLDQIRNNRTASLHICVAKPLMVNKDEGKQRPENLRLYNESPSERRGYSIDPVKNRRKSIKKGVDKMLSPKSPTKLVTFEMDKSAEEDSSGEAASSVLPSNSLRIQSDVREPR